MKIIISFILYVTFFTNSMAYASLIVIKDTGNTISSAPYLKNVMVPNTKAIQTAIEQQSHVLIGHEIDQNKLLYPNRSKLTPGFVKKHKLATTHFSTTPIFVMGADGYSVKWAKKNAGYLKKIHAIGMIVNVDTAQQTEQVEKTTRLKLMPTQIDGIEKIINVTHYPFLIYQGWVLQ